MRPAVVPIANLPRRLPEAGRLRTGVKTAKAMKAISTWRATSHDETAIRQLAAVYGGTPVPWTDAPTPDQWEVVTEAAELQIVLPPDCLGSSPVYEAWSGGGCTRRCDGVKCEVVAQGPDGAEMQEIDCPCVAKGLMECEPHLRLSVILPEIRFGGVWRLETKSWHAAAEIPQMVELIESLQHRGLTRGLLGLKHRKSVSAGQTRRFIVPVLSVTESVDGIAAGQARVGAVADGDGVVHPLASEAAALPAGDDVVDAVVVESVPPMSASQHTELAERIARLDEGQAEALKEWWRGEGLPKLERLSRVEADRVLDHMAVAAAAAPEPPPPPIRAVVSADEPMSERQSKALHAAMRMAGVMPDRKHAWLSKQLGRDITTAKELSRDDASKLIALLGATDEAEIVG